MGEAVMVEVTTTVAVTIALVSEIHGCTLHEPMWQTPRFSKLLVTDEATGLIF
jgi:hypothetical protein